MSDVLDKLSALSASAVSPLRRLHFAPVGILLGVRTLEKVDNRLHLAALVLADELDFDRAAKRLQISVSELRNRIAQLERTLSLALFVSSSTSITMTDCGRRYLGLLRKCRLR